MKINYKRNGKRSTLIIHDDLLAAWEAAHPGESAAKATKDHIENTPEHTIENAGTATKAVEGLLLCEIILELNTRKEALDNLKTILKARQKKDK